MTLQLHQRKRSKKSLSNEWATPFMLYHKLTKVYQIFPKLDVCATRQNTKCKRYFSKEKDALKQEWKYDSWMNLPNSIAQKFIIKANEQWKKHNINILSIMPINATVTKAGRDLIWNNEFVEIEPLLPTPRFFYNGKVSSESARNRYCVVIWEKR